MSTPDAYPRLKDWLEANVGHFTLVTQLSPRERELAQLLWDHPETTADDAGKALGVSPRTISNHLARINNKTGTKTRLSALKVLLESGQIEANLTVHEHNLVHLCKECGKVF